MPLGGRKLTVDEALALSRRVGFTFSRLKTAVAVMTAESGRYTEAYNVNTNGSLDRGLFQLNTIHIEGIGMADAFKAVPNARFAFELSKQGQDFTPWSAYNNGAHEQFMAEVTAAYEAEEWRRLVKTIFEELGEEVSFSDFRAGWAAHRSSMTLDPDWSRDKEFGWVARDEAIKNPQPDTTHTHPYAHTDHQHAHEHKHIHGREVEVTE